MYQGKFERKNRPHTYNAVSKAEFPAPNNQRKKRKISLFYAALFLGILLFCTVSFLGLEDLNHWLVRYELAQPAAKSAEIFASLFEAPDWGALYDLAGDASCGSKDAFVSRMDSAVGSSPLTFMETSAGLSGDKKYIVFSGKEKIAAFSLVNQAQNSSIADIPDWGLGAITFIIKPETVSYRILHLDSHTVYVNGTPLDESATVQISSTRAEAYLPIGTTGKRTCTKIFAGTGDVPTVQILDEQGSNVETAYDAASHTFTEQVSPDTVDEATRNIALAAIKTYALYMMKQTGRGEVAKYFLKGSEAYKAITETELGFVQDAASFDFTNETISDFCRYSDTLFSARVSVALNQHRANGSVKESLIEESMFFEKSTGSWLCYAMTAENVAEENRQVRFTFQSGDTVLSSEFYDESTTRIQCPAISVPDGKRFSGWGTIEETGSGETVMNLLLQPDENGMAILPAGYSLKPMTLLPVFS